MSKEKNKFLEYWLIIFGAIIGGVVTIIIDWAKAKPVLSTLVSMLKWIWTTIFEYSFSVWQIIVGILIIYLFRKIFKKQTPPPDFLKYRFEIVDGIKWKWGWALNESTKQYAIQDLSPVCIKCDTTSEVRYDDLHGYYIGICPRCNYVMTNIKAKSKVEAILIDNIQKDNYLGKNNR